MVSENKWREGQAGRRCSAEFSRRPQDHVGNRMLVPALGALVSSGYWGRMLVPGSGYCGRILGCWSATGVSSWALVNLGRWSCWQG